VKPQYQFETIGHKARRDHPEGGDASLAKRRAQHEARRQKEQEANQREAGQLRTLIISLGQEVANLDDSIASELTQSGAPERPQLAYPTSVRMMHVRRDNLKNTIDALTDRLSHIRASEAEPAVSNADGTPSPHLSPFLISARKIAHV
jgi:hypothetical protein